MNNSNGGVVNSSRGILLAYKKQPGVAFDEAAYNECVRMKEDIQGECNKLGQGSLAPEYRCGGYPLPDGAVAGCQPPGQGGAVDAARLGCQRNALILSRPISVHDFETPRPAH